MSSLWLPEKTLYVIFIDMNNIGFSIKAVKISDVTMTSAECYPHFIIVRLLACQAFSCSKRDVYIKKFVLLFSAL